ncbi:sarcosine oxidase subunit delta [Gymnodinialimonas sp. 2305UL16-5]|uniref:sarcosine oxidase subunit delta n=1 Tax=Gymnodinialimonas mytili TaxID=3126503 RepID=UPI00309591CB
MKIPCPLCGDRDLREFTIRGHATGMDRPEGETWSDAWNDFLHLRDNAAGATRELWYHSGGCGAWLVVDRDTVTHAISGAQLASEARDAD